MDQYRREAAAWAEEWRIEHKRKRIIAAAAAVILIAVIAFAVVFITRMAMRTTFSSADEMKEAVQGRYAIGRYYEDIVIEGNNITHTYLAWSHYDRRYAEEYGYDADEDSVYEDRVVKWDYKRGVIKTEWMGDFIVDKDGNLRRGSYSIYYKTDEPRPDPIDPATLGQPSSDEEADAAVDADEDADDNTDDSEAADDIPDERQEGLEAVEAAAAAAGVSAKPNDQ
jgi:hypothetical protein